MAITWQSHDKVTVNQLGNQSAPSASVKRKSADLFELVTNGEVAMKKGEKKYCFTPQMKPSTSIQKPRTTTDRCNQLNPLYSIKTSEENMADAPADLIEGYERNKENQASSTSPKKKKKKTTSSIQFPQKRNQSRY
ncbi:unnamed protein product [Rhizopus stolonifer]